MIKSLSHKAQYGKIDKDDSSGHVFKWIGRSTSFQRKMGVIAKVNRYSSLYLFLLFRIRPEVIPCVLGGLWFKDEPLKLWNPCQDVFLLPTEQPRDTS